ncbi:HEAT repeat domain-containing protein [Myxococcota bacterium]|nr:HEAT repeat domain-containing protein [Myxococcota bacterium]MBU1381980.1 HEAT repeat domain-containing protein [Myxococcota bacterium]MBU1495412.1 HEAT repeat domain-containing protein [Myxococcota bacterium]
MNICPVCRKNFELYNTEFHLIDEENVIAFCCEACCDKYSKSGRIAVFTHFLTSKSMVIGLLFLVSTSLLLSGVYRLGKIESSRRIRFDGFVRISYTSGLLKVEEEPSVTVPTEPVYDPVVINQKVQKILENTVENHITEFWGFTAAEVLAKFGDKKAMAKLLEVSEKMIPSHKMRISEILARSGDKKSLEFLRRHMNDRKSPLWIVSTYACGRLGDKTSIKHLRYLMMLEETRFAAAESLSTTGDLNSREWIYRRAIKSSRAGDRVKAAGALAKIKDKRAIPILKDAMEKTQFKFMSAVALGSMGDKSAVPVLEKALLHPGLRVEAAWALAETGSIDGYKILTDELDSPVFENRISAAISIYIMLNAEKNSSLAKKGTLFLKLRGPING